jgi:hypothetical protein
VRSQTNVCDLSQFLKNIYADTLPVYIEIYLNKWKRCAAPEAGVEREGARGRVHRVRQDVRQVGQRDVPPAQQVDRILGKYNYTICF